MEQIWLSGSTAPICFIHKKTRKIMDARMTKGNPTCPYASGLSSLSNYNNCLSRDMKTEGYVSQSSYILMFRL